MPSLNPQQLQKKLAFIKQYQQSNNAADASHLDANANVTHKNIATLETELMKDYFIDINRELVKQKITELYGADLAKEYERQITEHEIYVHDETSLKPYCASISMYPFLLSGLTQLGGESQAPKHLESFCGSFVNLVFAISAQFAGAIATVEFLMYFDYFARKDFGDDYLTEHKHAIENHLQHVVYALNQPAAARGYQSVFWNISLYDQYYFEAMFGQFVFPDFTPPDWHSLKQLQVFFLDWFNQERNKAILTFPVITAAMLTADDKVKDTEFAHVCAKNMSEGGAFFIYQSKNADSLASCCRLRNEISDHTFSYSLGAGGVATGSINVITINMNRLIQDKRDLKIEVEKVHQYQIAYRKLMEEQLANGMLPVYTAGFISLDKQFMTIGINGMVEAAESLGLIADTNNDYQTFVEQQLQIIYKANREATQKFGYKFNTEFVPAENLGIKNAAWDRKAGYFVNRNCYNSYFYPVEDTNINYLDKFIMHGEKMTRYLDGGSALHLNLDEKLSVKNYLNLYNVAARTGCNYFCVNVKITICNECQHIDKQTQQYCHQCGSKNIDYGTRVIGYLKRVSAFSQGRRTEHDLRYYHQSPASTHA